MIPDVSESAREAPVVGTRPKTDGQSVLEKSRRVLVIIWGLTHLRELARLVRFLRRDTHWQPVVMLGDSTSAPPEFKEEWDRGGVAWFVFGSVPPALDSNGVPMGYRSSETQGGADSTSPPANSEPWLLAALRLGRALAWACARRLWHILKYPAPVSRFVHQVTIMVRALRKARACMAPLCPDLVVLAEDNVTYPTALFIKAAREQGAPSVIIPYTLAGTREFVESFRDDPAYSTRRFHNWLVARLFPEWCHHERGRGILRLPGYNALAMKVLGLAPQRPWVPNDGRWDAFAVESPRMQRRYLEEFGMPAERLVLTGAMSDDALFAAKHQAANLKAQVYRELNLPPGRPMVLLAFPPDQFNLARPDMEFADYEDMTRFLIKSLGVLDGYNLVVSLHPRTKAETRTQIESLGAKVSGRDTLELVPACALYIASVSATIRWAIASGVPVINYDLFHYCYDDYDSALGVVTIQSKSEWLQLIEELQRRPGRLAEWSARQQTCAADWGMVDGRSGWRLVELFDKVAPGSVSQPSCFKTGTGPFPDSKQPPKEGSSMDARSALTTLLQEGFVAFRNLFTPAIIARAQTEMEEVCRAHVDAPTTETSSAAEALKVMRYGTFAFLVDLYGRSPALEAMVEKILTDPVTASVLEHALGKHYKVRGFNARRMLGNPDPITGGPFAIPHEWHRDWKGEFGISILLSDIPENNNAGTALVPGSHLWPYCPRENTLLSEWNVLRNCRHRVLKWFVRRLSFFSNLLGRKKLGGAVESLGAAGDVFYFFNDTWHGRQPNLHGRKTTVIFIGLFPTEFPFPDDVKLPPAPTMAKLPPRFRRAVSHDQPINQDRNTLVHRVLDQQRPAPWFSLFHLAHVERRFVGLLFAPLKGFNMALKWLQSLRRQPARPAAAAGATNPQREIVGDATKHDTGTHADAA